MRHLVRQLFIITMLLCLFSKVDAQSLVYVDESSLSYESQEADQDVDCTKCGYASTAVHLGQLIIKYNNQWRSVCSTNFNEGAANLACESAFGHGSTMISYDGNAWCVIHSFWLDNVQCDGTEDNLLNCNHDGLGQHSCTQSGCVNLNCSRNNSIAVQTRLEDGILQIQYQNEWRYVCDDLFGDEEAEVACKSIYGSNFYASNTFKGQYCEGLERVDFWLDDLNCIGQETNLAQCQGYSGWGYHDCSEKECIRLSCEEELPDEVSTLVHDERGVLSITFRQETRAVCDDENNWGETVTSVACKELYGNPDFYSYRTGVECQYNNTWLHNLRCSGNELKIEDCLHDDWGYDTSCGEQCVQIFCVGGGPYPPLITPEIPGNGYIIQNNKTGILSFNFQESFGAVCDDGFSDQSASVACYELYGNRNVDHIIFNQPCDYQQFWLDDVMCIGNEDLIRDCPHTPYGYHNCDPDYECIALFCQGNEYNETSTMTPDQIPEPEHEYRLTQSVTGLISMNVDGVNGNICQKGFDDNAATVVCRQLYNVPALSYDIGWRCQYDNHWLDDLSCSGTEDNLYACGHTPVEEIDCDKNGECVQVYCLGEGPQSETTLIQGETGSLGMIRNREARSICDDEFSEQEAEIACQELYGVHYVSFLLAQNCEFEGFWLDNVHCSGHETRIQDCQHNYFGVHDCNSQECVQLVCQYPFGYQPRDPQPEIYLVHNQISGVLSISKNNVVQGICDDGFIMQSAQVACFELYNNSEVIQYTTAIQCDYADFWLDDVSCVGNETHLKDCYHNNWGYHDCDWQNECLQLYCAGGGPEIEPEGPDVEELSHLRVNNDGILQIYFRGEIRAVCDDNFDIVNGLVACRQLYGSNSTVVNLLTGIECVDDDFWLDTVLCNGEENTIQECSHDDWGVHDCGSYECLQLFCTEGGPEPNTAPLVHGNTGILNVLYNHQIKSICDDGFNINAAETACNELYGSPEVVNFQIGQQCDYQEFWLDDVNCFEVKDKLTKCQHEAFGRHNCDPQSECILLECAAQPNNTYESPIPQTPPPVQIHLIHNQQTGVLSISKLGVDRAICDDGWSNVESQIVCQELYGDPTVKKYEIGQQCDYYEFWLDEVSCSGTESRLSDCNHNDWGNNDCNPLFECVVLYCENGGPQPERGQVIQNPITGVISISYKRETRGLCDDGFTQQEAQVICNELYGVTEVEQFQLNQQCDFQDFWLDNVYCTGYEQLLDDCNHNQYGSHDCNNYECVKVFCSVGIYKPKGQLEHSQNGILLINYDNELRSIADSGFGDNEASTACSELYQNPHFVQYTTNKACLINSFWLDSIQCQLGQTTIDSCQHTEYGEISFRTTFNRCVELYCVAGGPSVPRGYLVQNEQNGILQITYRSETRMMCQHGFDEQAAQVACLELHGGRDVIEYLLGQYCELEQFWLENINCDGTEYYLQDCPHAAWGVSDGCNPSNSCVALFCRNGGPSPPINPMQLTHSLNGILSVSYNHVIKALCDDHFDDQDAEVACRELYGDAAFVSYSLGNECEYEGFWVDNLFCIGTEEAIWQCPQNTIGEHDCNRYECVQLYCRHGPDIDLAQFVHDPITAIISVNRNGELKAICDDGFTLQNAQVFCRSMYNDQTVILSTSGQNCGEQLRSFWLDDILCQGDEVSLLQCSHLPWGLHNCNPDYECQQIYCAGGGPEPPSHLTQSSKGILSIIYTGQIKALCDTNFNYQAAQVACNQLFGSPEVVSYSKGHQCVYNDFWLSNVVCNGWETQISDCHHDNWGEVNCNSQNNCVKLFCQGGGAQPVTGRLEHSNTTGVLSFNYESVTKAICAHAWWWGYASIACLELYGNPEVIEFEQFVNCDYDEFWLEVVQCNDNDRLIGECAHLPYGQHNCNPRTDCIKLVCSQGGYRPPEQQFVVVHGSDASLNIIYNYELKSLCGDSKFNDFTASVACWELYNNPQVLRWSVGHTCTHPGFWLENVQCQGNEDSLNQCLHSPIGQNHCNNNQCVKLYCMSGGPRVDASPLVHSEDGILSILHEGQIKAVCDDLFNDVSARVACSELYSNPNVLNFTLSQSCDYNDFWLDNIQCNGGETRISDCIYNQWGNHDCNYATECIRLSCEGGGYPWDEPAQSVHNTTSGILSLIYRNEPRAVCDDYFNDYSAEVACQELYGNPNFIQYRLGMPCDYWDFWTDDIICQGSEESLSQCQHTEWGHHNCNPQHECVELICQAGGPPLSSNGTLQLLNHILSITYNGERRSVCDDGFNLQSAQVACLELTGDPTVSTFSGGHACEYQDFWLDDVYCRGNETHIQDCPHLRWGEHNCYPEFECIELYCAPDIQPVIELRHNPDTAIISLSIDGVQQGICDDGFTVSNARVVCQQLYGSPEVLQFEQGHACNLEGFWLDEVNCNGEESDILSCYHNPLGVHNCNIQTECVQLYCINGGPQPLARLTHNVRGILSIHYLNESRALCGNGFSTQSAQVACLELYANPEFSSYRVNQECQYQSFWIDSVLCEGWEGKIQDCNHSPFGQVHCFHPAQECVQLYCAGGGPQQEQFNVVQNPETGILSIQYQGVEKALCDHQFYDETAQVICRQLYGREAQVLEISHGHACDHEDFWLDHLTCSGDESEISQCDHSQFNETYCDSTNECVQLFCSSGPQSRFIQDPILQQNENGILSILYNNFEGNLYDRGFDYNAAQVACVELFNSSQVLSYDIGQPCPEYDYFCLEGLQCDGSEQKLMNCGDIYIYRREYDEFEFEGGCVQLYCLEGGPRPRPSEQSTLLHQSSGMLYIEYRGEVRSICDDGFSEYSAQVACNQLYGDSHVSIYYKHQDCDDELDGFWLDDVSCNGNEMELQQCPHLGWGEHNCNSEQCIRLYCSAGGPQPTRPTPLPDPSCVILYSQCGYQGEYREICENFDLSPISEETIGFKVMSLKMPTNYNLHISNDQDQELGVYIFQNIYCLSEEQGISGEEMRASPQYFAFKSKKITKNLLRKNNKN